MTTDERLAKLEKRVAELESLVRVAQEKIDTWAKSPGARKLAGMFGVKL